MKVQLTCGGLYEVDITHPLAGKRAIKRYWMLQGLQITILGIRQGVKANAHNAFVAQWGGEKFLVSRRDFKVLE